MVQPCSTRFFAQIKWLPLADYAANVFLRFGAAERRVVILDQLNPEWAEYYRQHEIEQLLADSGFSQIQSYHRHNYSRTVTDKKVVTDRNRHFVCRHASVTIMPAIQSGTGVACGDRQLPSSPQWVSIMTAPTIISGKIPDGTNKAALHYRFHALQSARYAR